MLSYVVMQPQRSALSEAVDAAVRELVTAHHRQEGSFISLPLLYPSGSNVVVRVSGGPEKFFVTDAGLGFTEAEFMGAERIYLRQARHVSDTSGVPFDDHAFFVLEAAIDRLPGAITTVANCSSESVALTAYKLSDKSFNDASARLIEKLELAFGAKDIILNEKITGASNHQWEFTAAVRYDGQESLFEFATKHANSVAAVAMKMSDVSYLERPPRRIVMVHNKQEMGTYLSVLSHSASVIDENIRVEQMQKLAIVA